MIWPPAYMTALIENHASKKSSLFPSVAAVLVRCSLLTRVYYLAFDSPLDALDQSMSATEERPPAVELRELRWFRSSCLQLHDCPGPGLGKISPPEFRDPVMPLLPIPKMDQYQGHLRLINSLPLRGVALPVVANDPKATYLVLCCRLRSRLKMSNAIPLAAYTCCSGFS